MFKILFRDFHVRVVDRRKRLIRNRGFTLIELLVVISIIGLIGSTVTYATNQARRKGRDARRMADARAVINALALYHADQGKVPCHGWVSASNLGPNFLKPLVDKKILARAPRDPINTGDFVYLYTSFKYKTSDACGQGAMFEITTETPGACAASGVPFSYPADAVHCHIYFPSYPPNPPCNYNDEYYDCNLADVPSENEYEDY